MIDIIVRMHRQTGLPVRKGCNHLVEIHVGGCTGSGLEYIDRKLIGMFPAGDGVGGLGNGLGPLGRNMAETSIGFCYGGFDQCHGLDELRRHAQTGNAEVEQRTLGLGAVKRIKRNKKLAETVLFNAEFQAHVGTPFGLESR